MSVPLRTQSQANRESDTSRLIRIAEEINWRYAVEETYGKYEGAVADQRQGDSWILTSICKDSIILDLGCGRGTLSFRLAEVASFVYAADRDSQCLRFVSVRKSQDNVANMEVVETDFLKLPFKDNYFDVIVVGNVFERSDMRVKRIILREIHRVLKQQGEVSIRLENCFGLRHFSFRRMIKKVGFCESRGFGIVPHSKNPIYIMDLNIPTTFSYLIRSVKNAQSHKHSLKQILLLMMARFVVMLQLHRLNFLSLVIPSSVLIVQKGVAKRPLTALEILVKDSFKLAFSRVPSFLIHSGLEVITLLVFSDDRKAPVGIIKISRDRLNPCLRREFEILSHIKEHAPKNFSMSIPEPVGMNNFHGFDVLSLCSLEGQQMRLGKCSTSDIRQYFKTMRSWIVELNRIPVPASKGRINRFGEAKDRISTLARKYARGAEIIKVVDCVMKIDDPESVDAIPTVITHRDLAPSNIFYQDGKIKVLDWGNSHYGYPLTDWIRFACMSFTCIEPDRNLADLMREIIIGDSTMSGVFYRETRALCSETSLHSGWVAPLFLLSLFDYLESYYHFSSDNWEEEFSFVFHSHSWVIKLMSGVCDYQGVSNA